MYFDGQKAPFLVSNPALTEAAAFENLNKKFNREYGVPITWGTGTKF